MNKKIENKPLSEVRNKRGYLPDLYYFEEVEVDQSFLIEIKAEDDDPYNRVMSMVARYNKKHSDLVSSSQKSYTCKKTGVLKYKTVHDYSYTRKFTVTREFSSSGDLLGARVFRKI